MTDHADDDHKHAESEAAEVNPATLDMAAYRAWRRGELDPADLDREPVDLGTLDMAAYKRARGR